MTLRIKQHPIGLMLSFVWLIDDKLFNCSLASLSELPQTMAFFLNMPCGVSNIKSRS